MARHFLAPTPLFGRTNKRLTISYQQRSPYYWWWAYMRRNAEYIACCESGGKGKLAKLFADFGDIRKEDFHKWWTKDERAVKLFAEQPLTVKFSELVSVNEWQANWTTEEVMVIAVPLVMSKRRIKGTFAKLLDSRHTGSKSGRPSIAKLKEVSSAKYAMERNYTISSLQITLAVYDLWLENQTRNAKDKLTLWQIGEALKINRAAIKDAKSTMSADRLIGRNVLAATVSRYVKQAKAMIENTSLGKFPML
jgi:hypothetical protein